MPLKLEEIYVDNYKSFHKATIKLDDFNIIVGANNAGKTNLVDLLEFIDIAVKHGLVTAVKYKGGFEKIKNFRSKDDFIKIKAVFKKSISLEGILKFPENFCYTENHCDEYILVFKFTGDNKYFSEIKVKSESKIKKITEEEFKLPLKDKDFEDRNKFPQLLKGGVDLDANISLAKEVEEIDDAVVQSDFRSGKPNDFEKKEHLEKYKRISMSPVINDDIKFVEGVVDETIDIEIKNRKKDDIDRTYYAALLNRFFVWESAIASKFIHEKISYKDYVSYLKSNTKFEDFIRKLFIESIKTYNFDVNAIRWSTKTPQTTAFKKNGSNLQYILEYLKNGGVLKKYDQHQFEIISASLIGVVDEVEGLVVEEQKIGTDKVPEIIFHEKKGFPVAREDISDGTLALLAIMAGLYANRYRHYLLVIEEPDRHLHMNAISYLMEVFRSYSKETQLIITTQNSEVMKQVNPDSDNLVFVYRDYDSRSQFISSGDIEEIKSVMEKYEYNVDDIVRNDFLGYLGDYA